MDANVITLYFVDAHKGDDILTQDGLVIDIGGPIVFDPTGPSGETSFGPLGGIECFIGGLTPVENPTGYPGDAVRIIGLLMLVCLPVFMRYLLARRIVTITGLVVFMIIGIPEAGQTGESTSESYGHEYPFYLSAGVGFTHIDETFNTEYLGSNYQLSVDNSVYPAFRFGYQSSEKIAWELGLRLDYYSGDMDRAESDGSSNPKGYTLFFGPVYTGQAYRCKYLGPLRPMVQLNLAYTLVHNDLAYPVTQFEPAVGGNIAIGVQRKSMDLRFGYRYFKLDRDNTLSGVDASSTSSELELSGFFMELSYRFWPWH